MDKNDILRFAGDFTESSDLNRVPAGLELRPDLAGMRIFDSPIAGFAAADDPYFELLLRPGVVGPHFRLPGDWLAAARTVVSFFFPFAGQVRQSNVADLEWPSPEWMHGRIEGQAFLVAMANGLATALGADGHETVVPVVHPDFWSRDAAADDPGGGDRPEFTSNWSERHVAHVAGLGTFGLSAGLITAKGMAGRFISLVTGLELPPDERPYRAWDEYCVYCGACIPRCVFKAISFEKRKDHAVCGAIASRNKRKFHPWYGCGKCQVRVPCETRIPPGKGRVV